MQATTTQSAGPVTFSKLVRQPWRLAAVLLIAVLFATNIYRAATQSVTHDEGTFFEWMLAGSWGQVLDVEHGNHHVLSDLLCKLTITLFGVSEFSLRIPALLGGLLYLYSVFRICELLFGEGALLLLSVALLSLNPFVLDYLACARGYGPALGFLFFGLSALIAYLATPTVRLLNKSGIALGLSIACNPVMLFPAGALIASLLAIVTAAAFLRSPDPAAAESKEKSRHGKKERRRKPSQDRGPGLEQALLHFALPAVAVGGFFLMLPKRLTDIDGGYLGPASLVAILTDLVRYSFVHSPTGFAGLAALFPAEPAIRIVTNFVVPLGLAALLATGARILMMWIAKRDFQAMPLVDRLLLLLAIALPVNIVLIVISRYALNLPYPELRTAMYWIPLLSLAFLSLLRRLENGGRFERMGAAALAAVLSLCVAQFVTQFNTRYFAEWAYCAAGRDMMQLIQKDHGATPGAKVTVGATWQLEPVINFYRAAWALNWLNPVGREGPGNSADYYVLGAGDVALVDQLRLKTLLRDKLSGTVLAKRSSP